MSRSFVCARSTARCRSRPPRARAERRGHAAARVRRGRRRPPARVRGRDHGAPCREAVPEGLRAAEAAARGGVADVEGRARRRRRGPARAAPSAGRTLPRHALPPRSSASSPIAPTRRSARRSTSSTPSRATRRTARSTRTGRSAAWMATFNDWFAAATGGVRLRVDTFAGQPDVSFLRLPETDTALTAQGAFANDMIYTELRVAGFTDPDEDVRRHRAGREQRRVRLGRRRASARRHLSASHAVRSFVRRDRVALRDRARDLPRARSGRSVCGALADGHVGDLPGDLMYAYAYPGTPLLDPGHDDYYGPPGDDHLPASCSSTANVANSLFLTSHPFLRLSVAIRGSGAVSSPGFFVCTPALPAGVCARCRERDGADARGSPRPRLPLRRLERGRLLGHGRLQQARSARTRAVTAMFAANPTARVEIAGQGTRRRGRGRRVLEGGLFAASSPTTAPRRSAPSRRSTGISSAGRARARASRSPAPSRRGRASPSARRSRAPEPLDLVAHPARRRGGR